MCVEIYIYIYVLQTIFVFPHLHDQSFNPVDTKPKHLLYICKNMLSRGLFSSSSMLFGGEKGSFIGVTVQGRGLARHFVDRKRVKPRKHETRIPFPGFIPFSQNCQDFTETTPLSATVGSNPVSKLPPT